MVIRKDKNSTKGENVQLWLKVRVSQFLTLLLGQNVLTHEKNFGFFDSF